MSNNPPVILNAAGFRLTLVSCGDRLAHTVGLVLSDRVVPLLASLEGTPDDDWPPSPPLTTVETPTRSPESQALLLGMAGRSHWSAAIKMVEAAWCMEFEVACRIKEPAAWLGSSYRTMITAVEAGDRAELMVGDGRVRIAAVGARVHVTPDGLKIGIAPPDGPFPQTVRWNYSICRVQ
jgi:hypothetical protein